MSARGVDAGVAVFGALTPTGEPRATGGVKDASGTRTDPGDVCRVTFAVGTMSDGRCRARHAECAFWSVVHGDTLFHGFNHTAARGAQFERGERLGDASNRRAMMTCAMMMRGREYFQSWNVKMLHCMRGVDVVVIVSIIMSRRERLCANDVSHGARKTRPQPRRRTKCISIVARRCE